MAEAGYITDQPWQFTYHRALSPQMVRLALAMAGRAPRMPEVVCELAFGQGLALAIHAACNPDIAFIGTDLNPGHVESAQQLAASAGLGNLQLHGDNLAVFCARDDLPRPDLVTMMGTWTWLPQAVQDSVVGFLARSLQTGGAFCLDHCTLPGMNGFSGLLRMLDALGGEGQGDRQDDDEAARVARIPATLHRAIAFMDTNPNFVGMHWGLRSVVEGLIQKSPGHVAHEYFNDHARPAYFAETAARLGTGGLGWMAPWLPHTGVDALHLPTRQSSFLAGISDPHRREQLRDFALNTARRMDVFVKSDATGRVDRSAAFEGLRFILARPVSEFDFKFSGAIGEVALARSHYEPLLQVLGALRPVDAATLREAVVGMSIAELCDALAILVGKDMVQVCSEDDVAGRAAKSSRALNAALVARAPAGDEIGYLGSPVTGTGVKVARHHQVFLLAGSEGISDVRGLAQFAMSRLKACGGRPLPPELGSEVLLARAADEYRQNWRPVYAALGIAEAG